jgi:hypothetical protein
MEPYFILLRIRTSSRGGGRLSGDGLSVHFNNIRSFDSIRFIIGKMLTTAGSSCVFEKSLVADTGVFLKADISTSISCVTTHVDVAIAELATASTHVLCNLTVLTDYRLRAAAEKKKVAKYKDFMRLSPTCRFLPFVMEANGRLGNEAQKLLIALSCAIVRMESQHQESINALQLERESILDASIFSCSSEGLRDDNFDGYCEGRNTRDLWVHGQVGFIAQRKMQQRLPRPADAFLLSRPSCRVSIINWSVCAREVNSEDRFPCDHMFSNVNSSFICRFPALHLLVGIGWCNLFGS